jgi:hypothetical protein
VLCGTAFLFDIKTGLEHNIPITGALMPLNLEVSVVSSFILTKQLAEKAVGLVLPSFNRMKELGIVKGDMHIVVLDPTDGTILYEIQIGDVSHWKYNYQEIARLKAEMSRKHGRPSQDIIEKYPYLLDGHDVKYFGNACQDGLIVAASGDECEYDQMISEMVVASIKGLSINVMRNSIANATGGTLDGRTL